MVSAEQAEPGEVFSVETPSGKGAGDENFPVGSFFLPKNLRPHVATFYAFARAIDDIADNPELVAIDKVARLDGFKDAILGRQDDPAYEKAIAMRESIYRTGVNENHCLDLISAFKQDATKNRYETWADLMDYCSRSAAPVGRYLLDLHGESELAYPLSDALCNALQVINHLQDCKQDYQELDRVYLPQSYLDEHGASLADLGAEESTDELRATIQHLAEDSLHLVIQSRDLPFELKDKRLAMESATIQYIAETLARKLAREDPVARRVELTKLQKLSCAFRGVFSALLQGSVRS